jgi:hypothetical protein
VSDDETDIRTRLVPLGDLLLDPNNPRLIEDPAWPRVADEDIPTPRIQRMVAEHLLGDRGEAIRSLLESIEELGWVDAEPVRVRELADGSLVVLDGNRRLVALRRHVEESDVVSATPGIRVIVEADPGRMDARKARGARHLRGRERWNAFSEVVWRRRMRMDGAKLDPGPTYEADSLRLCAEYLSSRWREQFRPQTFELFHQLLGYEAIRRWLGHEGGDFRNRENLQRLFSWISKPLEGETDGAGPRPMIRSFHDLRMLDALLEDPDQGLALIDASTDLASAWGRRAGRDMLASVRISAAQKSLIELRRMIEAAGEEPVEATSEQPWPVLRADASPSLASLTISRFRGLSDVVLDGLTRINLLVGVNNAGKTSVLEAVLLLCRLSDPRGLLETVRARVRMDPEALPSGGVARNIPAKASIASTLADGTDAGVEHVSSSNPSDADANIATFLTALRIEASYSGKTQISGTEFYTNRPRRTQIAAGERAWLAPAVFHSPFSLADRKLLSDCHERSYEAGTKDQIVEFIRQHVDENVEDIELVHTDGRFSVRHRTAGVLDLSAHGEGMQRIFQIGLLFAAHAHGVVLIDEFENALHTSVLTKFSRMIQELAVQFDVQVFLTTHSDEALEAFLRNGYRTEDVTTFRLKREGDQVTVRRFDGPSHLDAVEAAGVDVRRL